MCVSVCVPPCLHVRARCRCGRALWATRGQQSSCTAGTIWLWGFPTLWAACLSPSPALEDTPASPRRWRRCTCSAHALRPGTRLQRTLHSPHRLLCPPALTQVTHLLPSSFCVLIGSYRPSLRLQVSAPPAASPPPVTPPPPLQAPPTTVALLPWTRPPPLLRLFLPLPHCPSTRPPHPPFLWCRCGGRSQIRL